MNEANWYMIAAVANKEDIVIESLKTRKSQQKIEEIQDFYVAKVPHRTPTGKKRISNLFPGYIFIKLVMNDEVWMIIRNTEYVTGLIGSSGQRTKPTPVSEKEMKTLWNRVEKLNEDFDNENTEKFKFQFKKDDEVVVTRGEMSGMKGPVVDTIEKKNKVVIELEFFGKKVATEILARNVEKINN